MLVELQLENFRGFDAHLLTLRDTTIVVGRNNAGKSTLVEALRLISVVTSRYQSLGYREAPNWGGIPKREFGVAPSLKGLEIDFSTMFYRYNEPPAVIYARFMDDSALRIYLGGENQIHAVVMAPGESVIKSKSAALTLILPGVEILPQIAPLEKSENILSEDYVRGSIASSVSSKHFRNQLRLFKEYFEKFKETVEATWPGLQVLSLDGTHGFPGAPLTLQVRDGDFVAEVSAMGHGLQMWLQTMWFLVRASERGATTVILDEPDVYMHPDLQRRLIRFLRSRFPQTIIATHSVEIMSEVEPDNVLIVERTRRKSGFASSLPAVQKIVTQLGSAHNIHLARLWNAHRCLLVEGKDMKLIRIVHERLFPDSQNLIGIPVIPLGGWGGWQYAVGSSLFMKNAGDETIKMYCIFDSDYHSESAIEKRIAEAVRHGVELHVWRKKEIENYFLISSAIHRVIRSRIVNSVTPPSVEEVTEVLEQVASDLKDEVFDCISAEILGEDRALGAAGANRKAREILEQRWGTSRDRLAVIPGKKAFAQLSMWSQSRFGVSLSPSLVARHMLLSEIDTEFAEVVTSIENCAKFGRDS